MHLENLAQHMREDQRVHMQRNITMHIRTFFEITQFDKSESIFRVRVHEKLLEFLKHRRMKTFRRYVSILLGKCFLDYREIQSEPQPYSIFLMLILYFCFHPVSLTVSHFI